MDRERNPLVDKYLLDGCMRCKYGGTPQCKVLPWKDILVMLRRIALEAGLKEEIKWGVPVYTYKEKNIVTVNALKDSANLGFYKGVLLQDKYKILQQQGNIQVGRIIRFTKLDDVINHEKILKDYIEEAKAIEDSGVKPLVIKNPEPIPDELLEAFEMDPLFESAFYDLTPGRQRGYIIYFSQHKLSSSIRARIEKYKEQIINGIGLYDKFRT